MGLEELLWTIQRFLKGFDQGNGESTDAGVSEG